MLGVRRPMSPLPLIDLPCDRPPMLDRAFPCGSPGAGNKMKDRRDHVTSRSVASTCQTVAGLSRIHGGDIDGASVSGWPHLTYPGTARRPGRGGSVPAARGARVRARYHHRLRRHDLRGAPLRCPAPRSLPGLGPAQPVAPRLRRGRTGAGPRRGRARLYLVAGGALYLGLWIYGLAVGEDSAANFVPLNDADNWLHLGLGLGMLLLGLLLSARAGGSGSRLDRPFDRP